MTFHFEPALWLVARKDRQSSQTLGIEGSARFPTLTAPRCCAPVLRYISYVLASPEVELLAVRRAEPCGRFFGAARLVVVRRLL